MSEFGVSFFYHFLTTRINDLSPSELSNLTCTIYVNINHTAQNFRTGHFFGGSSVYGCWLMCHKDGQIMNSTIYMWYRLLWFAQWVDV